MLKITSNKYYARKPHDPKIYGFIHVGVMNDWERILNEEIEALQSSELMMHTEEIYVGVSGEKIKVPHGMKLGVWNPRIEEGENETMKFIHQKSKILNGNFWYIHTKGARWKIETREKKNADSWRKYMEYFIIHKWRDCIKALKNHDACGVEWTPSDALPKKIFSGNFWWANSNYIRSITKPLIDEIPYDGVRYKAEFFITQGNPKIKNFHQLSLDGNLYEKLIDPKVYRNNVKII